MESLRLAGRQGASPLPREGHGPGTGHTARRLRQVVTGLAVAAGVASASAATLAFSGNLGDPGDTALVDSDLGAALFDDDSDIADNIALHTFEVAHGGVVTIDSTGFAAGGVDPYFSLFSGSGSTAAFVDSNYFQAYSTGGDFAYAATLAAGAYEIALGTFANMSFAENAGAGTLGDGFIGFGSPDSLGDGSYSLTVTTPVPEPASWLSAGLGLATLALAAGTKRPRRQALR